MRTRNSITIGRVLGISIGLDFSWFLIFILITWMLAISYFPSEFHNWNKTEYWVVGAITSLLLFVSVILHELGHSIIALRYKVPVRSINLFLFGGVASIGAEPPSPIAEFWIAIAGPMISLALAGIFLMIEYLSAGATPIFALAKYLMFINFILAVFNIIPGLPLDGGRVLRAAAWRITRNFRKSTLIAAYSGRLIAFISILVGVWLIYNGSFESGLWIAFIGWFLESAANSQVQQQFMQDLLEGRTVSQAINFNNKIISKSFSLKNLKNQSGPGGGRSFPVGGENGKEDGILLDLIPSTETAPESPDGWEHAQYSQVKSPESHFHRVDPDDDLWVVLSTMNRVGIRQVPVVKDGQILGVLSKSSVKRYFRSLQQSQA